MPIRLIDTFHIVVMDEQISHVFQRIPTIASLIFDHCSADTTSIPDIPTKARDLRAISLISQRSEPSAEFLTLSGVPDPQRLS